MEGTSSSETQAALTCAGWNGLMRREPGAQASPLRRPREVSEGSTRRSHRQPTRLRSSTPTPRFGASLGSRSARSRRSCRQARGRWRPDDREVVRRRPWTNGGNAGGPGTSSKSGTGGFSHGARRAVSEGGVSSRVLVTRNVGCRSDFEASWRCDRGTPQGITRRNVERRTRSTARTGPVVILLAEGCSGRARAERPAQAPR